MQSISTFGPVAMALLLLACGAAAADRACANNPPAALFSANSTFDSNLGRVEFSFEPNDTAVVVVQNATTLKLTTNVTVSIGNGNATTVYRPEALLLFWGTNDTTGSRHQLEGRSFPLEAHLQLRNTSSLLATLAWVYNISSKAELPLDNVARVLNSSGRGNQSLRLRPLLPTNLTRFFRYDCGGRQWTVLAEPLSVATKQLQQLRQLQPKPKLPAPADFSLPPKPLRSFSAEPRASGQSRVPGTVEAGDKQPGAAAVPAASRLLLLLPLAALML